MILSIHEQLMFFIANFAAGIIAAAIFDVYRVMRGFEHPNKIVTFIEDILFLTLDAIIIFIFLLYTNEAYINAYVYVFIIFGLCFYMKFVSRIFVNVMKKIIDYSIKFMRILLKFIIYFFECLFLDKK
ncbi:MULTISPECIES: spore cortex biosynthesis protein YabQ [Clostridium]|uniref:spore cortex biosynthesis protein YabQ n=1 Tax=Clostridium TaxID=1485 RepID=UPI000826EDCA|nr:MULTISPECIES: spore cortex biosynthesis protein YabQ [Clostridium]PJI08791.1 spore cortex biosynthesis protein YabQ [Clostridium sp. CT7]